MARAPEHARFMHCLPASRGVEATDEVMDSPQSIIYDQSENRLHTEKGLLAWYVYPRLQHPTAGAAPLPRGPHRGLPRRPRAALSDYRTTGRKWRLVRQRFARRPRRRDPARRGALRMFDMILFSVCAILLLSQVTLTAQIGPSAIIWTVADHRAVLPALRPDDRRARLDLSGHRRHLLLGGARVRQPVGHPHLVVVLGERRPLGAVGLPDVLRGAVGDVLPRPRLLAAGADRPRAGGGQLGRQPGGPGHRQVGVQPRRADHRRRHRGARASAVSCRLSATTARRPRSSGRPTR